MELNKKTVSTIAAVAGLIAGGVGTSALDSPEVQIEEVIKEVLVEVPVDVLVEVPVEVVKYVNITDGKLEQVLEHVYDRDGDVEYITDELEQDEVQEIADAIVFVNDMVKLGEDYIKAELADELDREEVNGTELDEDDFERISVDADLDEVSISDFDWEDKDVDLEYEVEFEHDDVDYVANVRIEVRDGEIDEMDVVSVEEQ